MVKSSGSGWGPPSGCGRLRRAYRIGWGLSKHQGQLAGTRAAEIGDGCLAEPVRQRTAYAGPAAAGIPRDKAQPSGADMLAKVRRVLITAQFSAQRPPTGLARGPNILLTGNILRLVRPAAVPVAVEHRACRASFDWRLEPTKPHRRETRKPLRRRTTMA